MLCHFVLFNSSGERFCAAFRSSVAALPARGAETFPRFSEILAMVTVSREVSEPPEVIFLSLR